MELQSVGTFNMSVGRPIDALRFELMNANQIKYQVIPIDGLAMPVQSIVKLKQDPHPDYFTALDKLVPFAIKVLDLGPNWINESAIGSLKLEWTYSDREKRWSYKISEITIARSSNMFEIPILRSIRFGGIIIDDIPSSILNAIEDIMDEAWLYCTGKKTSQLNLFDVNAVSVDISPTAEIPKIVEALLEEDVERSQIDEYLDNAGDDPTFDGFFAWQEEEEERWQSEQNKDEFEGKVELVVASTRSKATTKKKVAV